MSESPEVACLRCQHVMEPAGQVSLVTGRHSGAAKFFLGQLAELDEQPWPLDVYRCPNCRHVDMFDPGS